MKTISKMLNRDLESFILDRNKEKQIKSKLPKNGKLGSAINGKNNLIKLVFDSKSIVSFLKKDFLSTLNKYTPL